MASNSQIETTEIKKRFDIFHREARFQEKPLRLLGKPQIINKQMSALFAYPEAAIGDDKTKYAEALVTTLKEYGLDPADPVRQKTGVRIHARLLTVEAEKSEGT